MSNEHNLPQGSDWIPDVLPNSLWEKDVEIHFGDVRHVEMLRIAEVEVGLAWQDLMRSYLNLGFGIHTGAENGEYQFIRRVGENEKTLSLDEEVNFEGTEWDKKAAALKGEQVIVYKTIGKTSSSLTAAAKSHNQTVEQMLERITSIGLRMSYELRYRDDIAYYLKTRNGGAVRINELKLGGLSARGL